MARSGSASSSRSSRSRGYRLELFTQFFESRLQHLPERFEDLMVDVQWTGVKQYAAVLLELLAKAGQRNDDA